MNSKRISLWAGLLVAAASSMLTAPFIRAQGTTAFTYQGRLDVSGFRWYKGGVHNDGSGQPGAGGTNLMHLNALGLL